MIKEAIVKIVNKEDLSYEEAYTVMNEIMSGETTPTQNAAFLAALSTKSARAETTDEIAGCAAAMRDHATKVETDMDLFEIVGTGGDNAGSFNISTTAALVAAAGGVKVAKHGNRSVSSKSGSADVLEQLGVNISLTPEQAAACLDQCGICFLFAQKFHGSMKFAAPSRREVGVRTVFNILGPLANPALTNYIVLGVYDEALMEPMAKVLMNLGIKGAMIVHGNDGLDEVTISDRTTVCEIQENKLIKYEITPEDYQIPIVDLNEIIGGTAEENAKITLAVLNGKQGPQRDIVVMNAACALYTASKAPSLAEGVRLAQESIDSGRALEKLEELKQVTAQYL